MTTPVCPPGWQCQFTQIEPKHYYNHWWDGPWGIVATITAIVAITAILIVIATLVYQRGVGKREANRLDKKRQADLAIEEQRTMQLDAAKGNAEMLKIVREMGRT